MSTPSPDLMQQLKSHNKILIQLAKNPALNQGDLVTALRTITATTAYTLNVERIGVWLCDAARDHLECLHLFELSTTQHPQGTRLAIADYPDYFQALVQDGLVVADDAHTDSRTRQFAQSYLMPLGITSMLDAPIILGGQTLGVVCLEHVGSARRWSPVEENFARSIADLVSLGLAACDRNKLRPCCNKPKTLPQRPTGPTGPFYPI